MLDKILYYYLISISRWFQVVVFEYIHQVILIKCTKHKPQNVSVNMKFRELFPALQNIKKISIKVQTNVLLNFDLPLITTRRAL